MVKLTLVSSCILNPLSLELFHPVDLWGFKAPSVHSMGLSRSLFQLNTRSLTSSASPPHMLRHILLLSCQHMSHFPKELEESHKSHNKSAYSEVLTDSGKALYNRAQDFALPSCPHPMLWICLACSKLCQSDECVRKPQDVHMFSTRKVNEIPFYDPFKFMYI
jgi:hypothetical protein